MFCTFAKLNNILKYCHCLAAHLFTLFWVASGIEQLLTSSTYLDFLTSLVGEHSCTDL